MVAKYLLWIVLFVTPLVFGREYDVGELMRSETQKTVAQKLETAPVAYYGTLESIYAYTEEEMVSEGMDETNAKVYSSFVEWKALKQSRIDSTLNSLPEAYRNTYNYGNNSFDPFNLPMYLLLREVVDVNLYYDKATKSWLKPDSANSKKVIFTMLYVGVDVDCDSSQCQLRQRVWLAPHEERWYENRISENKLFDDEMGIRRVFFLDGFTRPLETIQEDAPVYPKRMNQKLNLNYAIGARKRMVQS